MLKKIEFKNPSLYLFAVVSFLVLWGLFTVSAVSFPLSLQNFHHPWYYLLHQSAMVIIGIAGGFFLYKIPLEKIKKVAPLFFLANLFLLLLVFLPKIGFAAKGASRWFGFGFFSFQPSELLKLSFVLYLSVWLSGRTKNKNRQTKGTKATLVPFIVIALILALTLYFQKDLTTLVIIILIGAAVYFFAPTPVWHSVCLLVLLVLCLVFFIAQEPYRLERVTTFLKQHQTNPLEAGWQTKQAALAIGSGKVFGVGGIFGLGLSHQKFGYLPESTTDSIFAIIAEETGFFGSLLLLGSFILLFFLGLKLSFLFPNDFRGFAAFGISFWFCLQALLNIGGICGIIPLGGVPLPFFSYGGSHIISELLACGVLFNITRY